MKITEPMTMFTDYLLGGYTLYLCILMFQEGNEDAVLSTWFFLLAFLSSAIGAIVGGSSHGFKTYLSKRQDKIIWKITVYMIGIGSLCMLVGATISSVSNQTIATLLILIAILKFAIYAWWMSSHDEFIFVIVDYVPSMLLVIILKIITYIQIEDPSALWIISGIGVAFIAAAIQASGKGIHQHFNHNDIFHLIQLPAMYLIYRGVLLFEDLVYT
jgi:hypothetical protein